MSYMRHLHNVGADVTEATTVSAASAGALCAALLFGKRISTFEIHEEARSRGYMISSTVCATTFYPSKPARSVCELQTLRECFR